APHAYTVAYPRSAEPVNVTFTTTASASTGTPNRPATGTSTIEPPATRPVPTNRPSDAVNPTRVSANRTGIIGVKSDSVGTSGGSGSTTGTTLQERTVDVWLPAASNATAVKVCEPSARSSIVYG